MQDTDAPFAHERPSEIETQKQEQLAVPLHEVLTGRHLLSLPVLVTRCPHARWPVTRQRPLEICPACP